MDGVKVLWMSCALCDVVLYTVGWSWLSVYWLCYAVFSMSSSHCQCWSVTQCLVYRL